MGQRNTTGVGASTGLLPIANRLNGFTLGFGVFGREAVLFGTRWRALVGLWCRGALGWWHHGVVVVRRRRRVVVVVVVRKIIGVSHGRRGRSGAPRRWIGRVRRRRVRLWRMRVIRCRWRRRWWRRTRFRLFALLVRSGGGNERGFLSFTRLLWFGRHLVFRGVSFARSLFGVTGRRIGLSFFDRVLLVGAVNEPRALFHGDGRGQDAVAFGGMNRHEHGTTAIEFRRRDFFGEREKALSVGSL